MTVKTARLSYTLLTIRRTRGSHHAVVWCKATFLIPASQFKQGHSMRAVSSIANMGRVKIEPNPTPAPQRSSSQGPSPNRAFVEGDPDRPDLQTSDFSNGAIFVKIPGIIDVGDLPDGFSGMDVRV